MPSLEDLLAEIEEGVFALPEIQRPYVWTNPQVRELFESIYQGYPIGSIIVWEPAPEIFKEYPDLFRAFSKELEEKRHNFKYVVIDGQQRMLSVWLARKGKVSVIDTYGRERERNINLYFNVYAEEFFVDRARKKYDKDPLIYKVSDILDTSKDIEDLIEAKEMDDRVSERILRRKLNKARNSLLTYPINLYIIPKATLKYVKQGDEDNFLELFEKISQMFVKLNYTGTRVRAPHLVLALLTGKTRRGGTGASFRDKISKLLERLGSLGWSIGEGALMRSYLVISVREPRFSRARRLLNELQPMQIIDYLKDLEDSLTYIISDVLVKELNIKKPDYLKSEYLIVPMTYYAHIRGNNLSPTNIKALARWLILASFNRRYTGRLETDMAEDIATLTKTSNIETLVKNLQTTEIQEEWLDRTFDKEHLTMLSILLRDAYDLTSEAKRIRELRGKEIHIHHIFPRSQIQRYYQEYGGIKDMDLETAYNHVANITIISETANESIGNKLPTVYFKELDDPEILKSHIIPLDEELWKTENYSQFLEERKKLILEKLKKIF